MKERCNMHFSKALYYPSIDIQDEAWLKSAILFWDEINTIVPISIKNPYENYCTQYLESEEIIKPIFINPSSKYVTGTTSDVLKFVNSNASIQLFNSSINDTKNLDFHIQKSTLHEDKISSCLVKEIQRIEGLEFDKEGFYHFDSPFSYFYMTLLANRISEDKALALVTNNSLITQLTETIRYDNDVSSTFLTKYELTRTTPHITLKQGLLTNFVIDNIKISETTPLTDIVAFRHHHKDELAKFRSNLAKLVESTDTTHSFEALQQNIQTIYTDEFVPAYNDLKKSLNSSGIKWMFDKLSKLCIFSMSTTAVPVLLGLTMPQAVLIGTGISAVSSAIAYNTDKKEKLRNNPYSYLLEINKELGNIW